MNKEQILNAAMALDAHERDEVAAALWQSIVPGEFTPEQLALVRRRVGDLDTGMVQAIPGEQVMRELRQRFRR